LFSAKTLQLFNQAICSNVDNEADEKYRGDRGYLGQKNENNLFVFLIIKKINFY
jgi:hypothetical protein